VRAVQVHLHDSSGSATVWVRFQKSLESARAVMCTYKGSVQSVQVHLHGSSGVITQQFRKCMGISCVLTRKFKKYVSSSYALYMIVQKSERIVQVCLRGSSGIVHKFQLLL
jgi:hypothetical protein